MPVIKSARKKLRQDRKREKANLHFENVLKQALSAAKKLPSEESIRAAFKAADKAAKKHIIHKNKAARIKSALAKLLPKQETKLKTVASKKKVAKKKK